MIVSRIHPEPDHPQRYKSITDTEKILEFLDVSRKPHTQTHHPVGSNDNPAPTLSPAIISSKFESDKLISLVHDEAHDLNFLTLGCLNWDEVDKKGVEGGGVRSFVQNRINALEKYLADNPSASNATKAFWEGESPRTRHFSFCAVVNFPLSLYWRHTCDVAKYLNVDRKG